MCNYVTNSTCRKTAQIDWIEVVVLTALLDNSAYGRGCTDGARKEDIRKHSTAGQALVLVDLLPPIRGKAKWMDLWIVSGSFFQVVSRKLGPLPDFAPPPML